jgi:hypothetical protein
MQTRKLLKMTLKSLGMEEKVRWEEAGLRFLGFMTEQLSRILAFQ